MLNAQHSMADGRRWRGFVCEMIIQPSGPGRKNGMKSSTNVFGTFFPLVFLLLWSTPVRFSIFRQASFRWFHYLSRKSRSGPQFAIFCFTIPPRIAFLFLFRFGSVRFPGLGSVLVNLIDDAPMPVRVCVCIAPLHFNSARRFAGTRSFLGRIFLSHCARQGPAG